MSSRTSNNYETLNPYLLLRHLPDLAANTIPANIQSLCKSSTEAWELLEDGVFYFFHQILMLETYRLGAKSLFKQEPEGVVIVNKASSFAFAYDCKAYSDGYSMSSDDVLRYKQYIKKKRWEVWNKHHVRLTHFVVVSCRFNGDIDERVKEIAKEGIILSLLPACPITTVYEKVMDLSMPERLLLEPEKLLCSGVVPDNSVKLCLGEA